MFQTTQDTWALHIELTYIGLPAADTTSVTSGRDFGLVQQPANSTRGPWAERWPAAACNHHGQLQQQLAP